MSYVYRAIYLSGGVTMLPGFAERLQSELQTLAPPSVLVEVRFCCRIRPVVMCTGSYIPCAIMCTGS
jgi:actin-related protein